MQYSTVASDIEYRTLYCTLPCRKSLLSLSCGISQTPGGWQLCTSRTASTGTGGAAGSRCKFALYCTVLYCTSLYCTELYRTVLCYAVLYCTILYCTVLYGCTVLSVYCIVLYGCTVVWLQRDLGHREASPQSQAPGADTGARPQGQHIHTSHRRTILTYPMVTPTEKRILVLSQSSFLHVL